jgi:hypothetical protein
VPRVVVDGLTPKQAADEAIARIKQILSEYPITSRRFRGCKSHRYLVPKSQR